MSPSPSERQLELLTAIAARGGYIDEVEDMALAEACVDHEWLAAEGETGYALTLEGHALIRRLDLG